MCGIAALIRLRSALTGLDVIRPETADAASGDTNESISNEIASSSLNVTDNGDFNSLISNLIVEMVKKLDRRGPDHHGILTFAPDGCQLDDSIDLLLTDQSTSEFIQMHGHLLAMRSFFAQPVFEVDAAQSVARCFIWNGECFKSPFMEQPKQYDSSESFNHVEKSDTQLLFDFLKTGELIGLLSQVEGPWSLVYYNNKDSKIYFGRDPRGRRSLMLGIASGVLILSSVPQKIPNLNVEWIEVNTRGIYEINLKNASLSLIEWPMEVKTFGKRVDVSKIIPTTNGSLKKPDDIITDELEDVLRLALRRRIHFHGQYEHTQGASSSLSSIELKAAPMSDKTPILSHSSIAVLFSGGLDSTVLAALAHKEMPPGFSIDLINVAFGTEKECSLAPDRVTGLSSYEDLCRSFPERSWKLILVNISKSELDEFTLYVVSLMYPNDTIMDISISAPLWFASQGIGMSTQEPSQPFQIPHPSTPLVLTKSTARVLIVGAGADEQFAGYGRHRVQFKKQGWDGLQQELDMDMQRLWKRNLGRDDRVMSDHSKEARFPFLDMDVMKWISDQNLWDICDMSLPPGEGDKRALRLVASRLGLTHASKLAKRAIQFGTKIVKQMPKGKGTDHFES